MVALKRQKKVKSQDFSSRAVRRSSLKSRKAFLHIFTLPIEALLVKSFRFASLVKRSASHPVKLLPDGSKDGGTGKTHLRCLNNGKAAKDFFQNFTAPAPAMGRHWSKLGAIFNGR